MSTQCVMVARPIPSFGNQLFPSSCNRDIRRTWPTLTGTPGGIILTIPCGLLALINPHLRSRRQWRDLGISKPLVDRQLKRICWNPKVKDASNLGVAIARRPWFCLQCDVKIAAVFRHIVHEEIYTLGRSFDSSIVSVLLGYLAMTRTVSFSTS